MTHCQLLEPVANRVRHHFREHEVPEEHLHQQRNIAEQFDIGIADTDKPGKGGRSQTPTKEPTTSAISQANKAVTNVQPAPNSNSCQ